LTLIRTRSAVGTLVLLSHLGKKESIISEKICIVLESKAEYTKMVLVIM